MVKWVVKLPPIPLIWEELANAFHSTPRSCVTKIGIQESRPWFVDRLLLVPLEGRFLVISIGGLSQSIRANCEIDYDAQPIDRSSYHTNND